MELQKVNRKKAKIKMSVQGPSGSGKTYSALLLAYGLCGDYSKVAVIDTENHSSSLYAHLGNYNVLDLSDCFSPERYVEAIKFCEKAGMQVIIIDSITHEWEAILGVHALMPGNSFTNWSKVSLRHNAFVQSLLQSPAHVIATVRSKQDYVLTEKNGKQVPEKVGMKAISREGIEYEFTIVFNLDMNNQAMVSKDRTGLFSKQPEFVITEETGKKILAWCNQGEDNESSEFSSPEAIENVIKQIEACKTYEELIMLYRQSPTDQETALNAFKLRRDELLKNMKQYPIIHKTQSNGTTTNK